VAPLVTVDLEQLRRDLRREAWRFAAWFVPLLLAGFGVGLAISYWTTHQGC